MFVVNKDLADKQVFNAEIVVQYIFLDLIQLHSTHIILYNCTVNAVTLSKMGFSLVFIQNYTLTLF